MNEMLKKPYKITLWEDRNKVIYSSGEVQNQWLEEVCIATIGSNTMDSPIRAFNPILVEELNGSKTFTFSIYSKYWDDKDEEFKDNPFIKLLVNERKVKLHYNFEEDLSQGWYDFVIKQVQENSADYIFTYTCKDLFVNELGKTGYSVELDTELQNNMGTITQLGNYIVEGTDWQIGESDLLIQKNKEGLYSYVVPQTIFNVRKFQDGTSVSNIAAGQVLLIFYSSKANHETPTQFLYKEIGNYSTVDEAIADYYKTDEYGFIINAENLIATLPSGWENNLSPTGVFGQKIIRKQETHYLPQIGETCSVYTKGGNRYYAYTELEYSSVAEIQNMLSNGSGFISTNGWVAENDNSYVLLSSYGSNSALQLSGTVYNTGFYDNRALLSPNGFTNGEKYVLMVRHLDGFVWGTSHIELRGNEGTSNTTILTFNTIVDKSGDSIVSNFDLKNDYTFFTGECSATISYTSLVRNYGDIRFYLGADGLKLIDCKVFKYRLDSNGKLIIPDLQKDADSIIKTRYNFFLESGLESLGTYYTKQDLNIAESLLEDEIGAYTPVYFSDCEKITSITGSKSNRFNLIQSLCEAFECWAKFTIEHDESGRILYEYVPLTSDEYVEGGRYYQCLSGSPASSSNDNIFAIYEGTTFTSGLYKKVYSKYINFKEYIGENNLVGFKYGINLKSIQRNLVSDQIASKVIVQPNTNQFAPNGSCTIQQSILNPTGENALYNFQYFVNHGLLDPVALNSDLYGLDGGLGFFSKMREYNDALKPYVNQLSEISDTLYTLESRQAVYDALMLEADKLKRDTEEECRSAGYNINGTEDVPNYIKDLRDRYKTYSGTLTYYSDLTSRNKDLLEVYQQKYEDVEATLKTIRKKKDRLNNDFENKYYRFIQEGTWNSNDYYDPELYYQAANMVLYTSSFPQVSYSINVLEISEIEGFELYKFKIADKTFVEDTEFFGYDTQGRPYKEEIVISQIKSNLDDPSQNTITVQNYKTQFQDLFQRMAASSQSLQYHEGEYQRAASAINDDGTINSALMQNTMKDNALIIQNARNQSVVWDETGITIKDFLNANEVVRLTSKGIALTTDGGRNWTTGITGDGINADVITAGRIDTDRIRIFNKAMQQTFEWNDKGINAYMWDSTMDNGLVDGGVAVTGAVDYGKFVRFDKYGLYGYSGGDPSWNPSSITDVIDNSIFSLTWNGLSINIPTSGAGAQQKPVITVGPPDGQPTFQVDAGGNVTLKGNIYWSDTNKPEPLKLYSEALLESPDPKTEGQETLAYYNSFPDNDPGNGYIIEGVTGKKGWYDNETNAVHPVYESDGEGASTFASAAKITFKGYTQFQVKISSNSSNSSDYTMASKLDASSCPQASGNPTVKEHTRNKDTSETPLTVDYGNITDAQHYIYIVYQKGSGSSIDTTGYFSINEEQKEKEWHKTYNSEKDKYVAYSYDGGKTWTVNAMAVDGDTVYDALVKDRGKLGLFYDSTKGLCINADYITTGSLDASLIKTGSLDAGLIKTGTLDATNVRVTNLSGDSITVNSIQADRIESVSGNQIKKGSIDTREGYYNSVTIGGHSNYGYLREAEGDDGKTITTGIMLCGNSPDVTPVNYFIVTSGGARMTAGNHSIYTTSSGCFADGSAIQTTSDRRLKDNINYDLSQYEDFIKEIKPCSFTFKTEPNKISFGFIAQDIENLLLKNNFDKNNFSILNILKTDRGDKYFLSYDNFIALQQWQIQKLEKRIERLENLISS